MQIGLTSGCWDLIHVGHLSYLERCRRSCDKLIVGVDCDTMVSNAKGSERPFTPDLQRLELIQSLSWVDSAFILRSLEDLDRMAGDFHVTKLFKHEGYKNLETHRIYGLAWGAKLEIVPDVPGLVSTTEIVTKIRAASLDSSSRSVVESMKRERDRCLEGVQKAGKTAAWISRERDVLVAAVKEIAAGDSRCAASAPIAIAKRALRDSRHHEGDSILLTDFENKTHEATLKRVVPVMHECDDEPCKHRIWAAVWPIEVLGADKGTGERVWPIGENWDRVRPEKFPSEEEAT